MIKVLPGDSREDIAKRVAWSAIGLLEGVIEGEVSDVASALELFHQAWREQGVKWTKFDIQPLNLDDWLTATDVAELAEVEPATIRQWRHRGHITARRGERFLLYNVGEVLAYQRRQREARARARTA